MVNPHYRCAQCLRDLGPFIEGSGAEDPTCIDHPEGVVDIVEYTEPPPGWINAV